jgi:hypothetical protein
MYLKQKYKNNNLQMKDDESRNRDGYNPKSNNMFNVGASASGD